VSWGIHVFKDGDGKSKGPFMEKYCQQMFEAAAANPGDDFFSALNRAQFEGRPLTMEEKLGYANIAFAGGRDTIIHTVTRIISYFAENPQALQWIRGNPDRITLASEEFFRLFIPLTHIGRVCPVKTDVFGFEVQPEGRVSLCWSSANRDPEVFAEPNEIRLDRKPNPHVAFGFGAHLCLGAHHARAVMRGLIQKLAERVSHIEILEKAKYRNSNTLALNQLNRVPGPHPCRPADALPDREQILSFQRGDGLPLPVHAVEPDRLLRRQSPQR
jgi:cytochrome P450